jgi:hypothetical protein
MLTIDEIRDGMPAHLKGAVTQDLVNKLSALAVDPDTANSIREKILGHTRVLQEGRFKFEDYAMAASFVSFRMMGYNNQESYARTFPAKYQALVARGATSKDISAYVSAYSRNKLVNLVLEQAMTPVWVINQDVFQEAVATQVKLMTTAKSEMVRMQAANSLLAHLKPPEKKQLDMNLNVAPDASGLDALKGMLTEIADRQLALIASGVATREVAHQALGGPFKLIDVTPVEKDTGNIQ